MGHVETMFQLPNISHRYLPTASWVDDRVPNPVDRAPPRISQLPSSLVNRPHVVSPDSVSEQPGLEETVNVHPIRHNSFNLPGTMAQAQQSGVPANLSGPTPVHPSSSSFSDGQREGPPNPSYVPTNQMGDGVDAGSDDGVCEGSSISSNAMVSLF